MNDLVNERCSICGNPVYAHQGVYTIDLSHYSCAFSNKSINKKDHIFKIDLQAFNYITSKQRKG